jgi:hypothetical protein
MPDSRGRRTVKCCRGVRRSRSLRRPGIRRLGLEVVGGFWRGCREARTCGDVEEARSAGMWRTG